MKSPAELALLGAAIAAATSVALYIYYRTRQNPAERERKRRLLISQQGRLMDGIITESRDGSIYYSYSWRGIDYETAQDISTISQYLRPDPETLVGAVTVKFLSQNPYNSIVVSEEWSGLPKQDRPEPAAEFRR